MTEDTLIVSPKEGVKSVSGTTPGEGTKKSFFSPSRIVGLFVLALLFVWIANHYRGNKEVRELELARARLIEMQARAAKDEGGSKSASTATIQWQPVYGHFVVRAGKVRAYTLNDDGKRPGENLFVVPARCITYGKLVNGREAGIFPADPTAATKPSKIEINPLARTVGYYAPESTEDEIFLFVSTPEIQPPADFIWRAAQTVPH